MFIYANGFIKNEEVLISQLEWVKLKWVETARLCIESQEDLRAKNIFCILNINFSLYLLVYLLFELIMVLISLKFQLPLSLSCWIWQLRVKAFSVSTILRVTSENSLVLFKILFGVFFALSANITCSDLNASCLLPSFRRKTSVMWFTYLCLHPEFMCISANSAKDWNSTIIKMLDSLVSL